MPKPKPKRIKNLLKSIDGSSPHQHSSSLDASEQPSLTPNDPVQPGSMNNSRVLTPPHPWQVVSSPVVDTEASQLPTETSSQPAQPETRSSKRKVGRQSNHYWLVDAIDDGSSPHQHSSSLDASEQSSLTPNDPVQPGSMSNSRVLTPPHPWQVVSSPVVDSEASQLPTETSSQLAQPETRSSKRKVGRQSSHYWLVDAIDEQHHTTQKLKLKVKDVHNLRDGLRIVVDFDECFSPVGEAAGLLAGVCGQSTTNNISFPINFDKWSDMPNAFFESQWNTLFMARFCFKVNKDIAKRYVEHSIGKKWKEYRLKLWNEFYDPTLSKNEIIKNVPEDVSMDQWASYVNYRLKPETMELCKRNQEIRKKQTIPHTCGAKTLARRRHELRTETGKIAGRGPMWNMTHKRKDGSYVNDKAMEIGEIIDNHVSQRSEAASEISPNDVVGLIFGKEHPGRVRGLGLGAVPTLAFKHTTTRLSGMDFGSSSSSTSYEDMQNKVANMESELKEVANVKSQMQALIAYISAKEGGKLPDELAGLFSSFAQQASDVGSRASSPKNTRSSG